MALIVFPFDDFLNEGYREELQTTYVETTPDAGSQFRRETNTDANKFVTGNRLLSDSEKISFMNFYLNATSSGSLPFQLWDCLNNIYRTARFYGKPKENRQSDKWVVSCTLLLDPLIINKDKLLTTESGFILTTESGESLVAEVEQNV